MLSVFKELHARVERESDRKLKAVRADNGGEYRGAVRGVLPLEGNPARIYRAEDVGTKRTSREDEPDHNGEGPEYASTCQVTQEQRRSVRFRSDNTSSSSMLDTLSPRLPLFYSFKKGAVSLINYLPTESNYLGSPLYLILYSIH